MIDRTWTGLCSISPRVKRFLWKKWYQFIAGLYHRDDWSFMNYGYVPLDSDTENLPLDDADEPNRYSIQLYHHVAGAVDLSELDVLEVGSGRGGGSHFIKRYLRPKTMVGVDISEKAVALCNRSYSVDGLSFMTGDAERLPFDDNSFDAVVNVESSHCYGSMETFLNQVKRVLRRGGHFLYADLRGRENVGGLVKQLRHSGMRLVREANITSNVTRALTLDDARKKVLINNLRHRVLSRLYRQFAAVKGSKMYEGFRTGKLLYMSFVLRKT